jgi:hypothetical protein
MKILFFGNCCESLECEENISKLKNVKTFKIANTPCHPEIFLLSDFADNLYVTAAHSPNETN